MKSNLSVLFCLLWFLLLVVYLRIHCQIQEHVGFSSLFFFQEFYQFSCYVYVIDLFELVLWFCGSASGFYICKGKASSTHFHPSLSRKKKQEKEKRTRLKHSMVSRGWSTASCRPCFWSTWDLWFSQNSLRSSLFLLILVSTLPTYTTIQCDLYLLVIKVWFVSYPDVKLTISCIVLTVNTNPSCCGFVRIQYLKTSPAKACGWNPCRILEEVIVLNPGFTSESIEEIKN